MRLSAFLAAFLWSAAALAQAPTGVVSIPALSSAAAPSTTDLFPVSQGNAVVPVKQPLSALVANPTATIGTSAVNGSAATLMRSDAAPAAPTASNSTLGLAKCDNTTITCGSGSFTAVATTGSLSASVTAAGSNQGGATALTSVYNDVLTVAPSTGVALPTAIAGRTVTVCNSGPNTLTVYPASSAAIGNLGLNFPVLVYPSTCGIYNAISTTLWRVNGTTTATALPFPINTQSPAFFVAPSGSGGNDSNVGSYDAPFLTPLKCATQLAIYATSSFHTCFFRAGTYSVGASSNILFTGAGQVVVFATWPPDGIRTAIWDFSSITAANPGFGCSTPGSGMGWVIYNLTIKGFPNNNTTAEGAITGACTGSGSVPLLGEWILNSTIDGSESCAQTEASTTSLIGGNFQTQNGFYIQGNTIVGCGSVNPFYVVNPTIYGAMTNLYITDNVISGCGKFCVQIQNQSSGTIDLWHVDRNMITNAANGAIGISAVGVAPASGAQGGTIWGNLCNNSGGSSNTAWCIETVNQNSNTTHVSIEYNTSLNFGTFAEIGTAPGIEIQNNYIQRGGSQVTFGQDGGWNNTQWLGQNTVSGTLVNFGTGCGTGSPTFCSGAGWATSYGANPGVLQPTPVFPPGW